ncbi:MAG: hypothetical protein Kow00128_04680 [Deltaproteobacteria bacterium]
MDRSDTNHAAPMNLLRRFSLLLGAALLLFGLVLGEWITHRAERTALEKAKEYLARYIREEVQHRGLTPEDFAVPKTGDEYESFGRRLKEIREFGDALLLAVLSPKGEVVWSDLPEMVGKSYASPGFRAALRGEVVAELTAPERKRHRFPSRPGKILELYVPIVGEGDGPPHGIVEIYQDADPIFASFRQDTREMWATLFGGFALLYLTLFWIVGKGHRLIRTGQEELRESRETIRAQNEELIRKVGASVRGEREIDKVLQDVTGEIRRLLDLPRVTIRIFGDPDMVVEDRAFGVPSAGALFPGAPRPAESEEIRRTGLTRIVEDARTLPGDGERKEALERIGLRAWLGVPLRTPEGILGALFLDRATPHRWSREEVETAEAVAGQVGMAIRQARLAQEQEELTGRLFALMNNVPGLVYRGFSDWSVGFLGSGADRITGYPAEEFLEGKRKWNEVIDPEDLERIGKSMREAIRNRDPLLRVEYRIRQRDGSVKWIADRRQLVYDADGRFLHVDGLALDITDRKRTEETLRLIRFTVDRALDAAYWVDREGRFLYVNDTTCATLGYSREELLSMWIGDINPDFSGDVWRRHWEEVRRRRSFLLETRHRAKDGRIVPVEVSVNYLEFDGKEFNCAFARDISERLLAREESERLQEQLLQSQKMEALGILAGGVAHDFNNLLTGILGYADLLDREALPGTRTGKAAKVIRESAERASRLTAQLLGFARKGKNLAVSVDLVRTAGDVAKILERTIDRRIRIVTRFPGSAPAVLGDPTQLSQVAMNLGVNARDAMPEGGELTIAVEERELDDAFCRSHPGAAPGRYVALLVRDTGVGIPAPNLSRIFEPFFSTKEPGKGSGLGLSMVFGIVKNHGGLITVDSREGEGTAVTVFLPAHDGRPAAEDDGDGTWIPRSGRKGVVLLVDDEETVREVCASMLDVLGYEVIPATDGEEGVARYRERWKEIDLVILDMIMPKMGGRDCFRRIREINPAARALLATGYSLDGAVQETLNEGIEGFLQKPFRLDQLAGAVSRALRRSS